MYYSHGVWDPVYYTISFPTSSDLSTEGLFPGCQAIPVALVVYMSNPHLAFGEVVLAVVVLGLPVMSQMVWVLHSTTQTPQTPLLPDPSRSDNR